MDRLQAVRYISQQMLADWLFVTKGNVVGLLNRLEGRGLVERRPDPEDGRTHVVSLTKQGAALAARVVPEHEELVAECMGLTERFPGVSVYATEAPRTAEVRAFASGHTKRQRVAFPRAVDSGLISDSSKCQPKAI